MKLSKPRPKVRKHHNNKGLRGIKTGTYYKSLKDFAKRNHIPFGKKEE